VKQRSDGSAGPFTGWLAAVAGGALVGVLVAVVLKFIGV
jgi:hypothetical protein